MDKQVLEVCYYRVILNILYARKFLCKKTSVAHTELNKLILYRYLLSESLDNAPELLLAVVVGSFKPYCYGLFRIQQINNEPMLPYTRCSTYPINVHSPFIRPILFKLAGNV
jgi:hypothetical protein